MLSYARAVTPENYHTIKSQHCPHKPIINGYKTVKSINSVNECKISLNYSLKDLPTDIDSLIYKTNFFKNVEIFNNIILDEIMKNYYKIISNGTALIIVDGSRYTIEYIALNKNLNRNFDSLHNFFVKQYVNHYDSKQEKLIPVYVRYVWISLK
jgi:hypothetical protein